MADATEPCGTPALDTALRAALDALPFGVQIYGPDRRAVWINRAFLDLAGATAEDLPVGIHAAEVSRVLHPRGWFGTGAAADALADSAAVIAVDRPHQLRRRAADGRLLEVRYTPLPGGGFVVATADISALGAAEAEASARGQLLEMVQAASRTGLIVFGPDRRVRLCNNAYRSLFDLPADALPAGTTQGELLDLLRARGEYANIDAEQHVRTMLAADFSAPRNARHVRPNGRVLESVSDPLPGGGFAISVSDVTALVATEHALAERGRVLDTVLAASRSGMAVYDADQRLVLHNAAYTAILGLAPDALPPGFRFAELVGLLQARGEYANIEAEPYIAALLGADHKRPHARRRPRPNGQVLEIASDPLPDGGFVVTVSDVTALARAEEETRARAATLESVLASLPQGISLFGPDRRVRLVNPAYAAIMGDAAAQPGEAMAQLIERRRRAGEYGQGAAADSYAIEAGTDFQHAARRRRSRPDGTIIDVRTRPLPDGGHISVVTDVTLEVAAQAEAERRTRMLDLMMAHVNHGMVLFDADERVVLFNSQGEALAGIEPGWLRPGHTRQEIILHLRARGIYGRGPEADRMAQDFSNRDPHRVQHIQRTLPDGRVIELRSDPLPGGGCVVATWDVSWRRETEAQMRAAKEAAEAASRAKSSFLATISHELRTPLNAVIGFSEAIAHELERLAAGADSAQRIGEFAQAVNDGGRHLLGLINDILDVARIESGTVELAETEFDLAMLVGQCRRMIDVAARVAQVRLETHLPAALPRVRGDEPRLRQVLLNLLSNAVKFTPAGGVVRVGAELPTDQALLLTVQDTGIGIAPADIDRAFEPFTRLDTEMGRRSAGSGLGLFLSRALAEAHGGSLDLRSTPGQGTTAILRLPAARVLHSTPRMPISAP